jgi:hypothetical protein
MQLGYILGLLHDAASTSLRIRDATYGLDKLPSKHILPD